MNTIDLNGTGDWSVTRVTERYAAYCDELDLAATRDLQPYEYVNGNYCWIYPILEDIVEGIVENDEACIALGIDLIESNQQLPFGRKLKSKVARALRRSTLTEQHKTRIRKRLVSMLIAGTIPHEFREYSKLLRTVGIAEFWPELHTGIPRQNPYAVRFYDALLQNDAVEAKRIELTKKDR